MPDDAGDQEGNYCDIAGRSAAVILAQRSGDVGTVEAVLEGAIKAGVGVAMTLKIAEIANSLLNQLEVATGRGDGELLLEAFDVSPELLMYLAAFYTSPPPDHQAVVTQADAGISRPSATR